MDFILINLFNVWVTRKQILLSALALKFYPCHRASLSAILCTGEKGDEKDKYCLSIIVNIVLV
jgi:hypothetical protein